MNFVKKNTKETNIIRYIENNKKNINIKVLLK